MKLVTKNDMASVTAGRWVLILRVSGLLNMRSDLVHNTYGGMPNGCFHLISLTWNVINYPHEVSRGPMLSVGPIVVGISRTSKRD